LLTFADDIPDVKTEIDMVEITNYENRTQETHPRRTEERKENIALTRWYN
jgi:hypothetical protein